MSQLPQPPMAKVVPSQVTFHGDTRVDPYSWLRQRETDPDVIGYLEAENAYTEAMTAPTKPLQERLFDEIRSRVQETDLSVPLRKGGWWYYARTEEGQSYGISCRRAAGADRSYDEGAPEQILLDQNVEAEGTDYFGIGVFSVSPDHQLMAWAADTDGSEKYKLRFRDLSSGKDLDGEVIDDVYYGSAWAADNRTFFYVRPDEAMRPYQLWRHVLGQPTSDDVLVHEEPDERFFLSVGTTRDDRWIFLHLGSKVTDEWLILPADQPEGTFRMVEPRQQGVEYGIEAHGDRFFVVTNADGAENFKLMVVAAADPRRANWTEVIPHRPDIKLNGVDAFRDHLVIYERADGLQRISIRAVDGDDAWEIDQPEAVGTATGAGNPEFDTTVIRYSYQSMITPPSVFDYDLVTRERTLLKQQPVLGGYDADEYVTERLWATAADGVQVPMSLAYRKSLVRDGSAPSLLYGYGSYEASMDPWFSSIRLSLLDRGFVYAIAHIRGGGEMGRGWYLDGKLLNKRNTFDDFVACAEHLVAEGWTNADRLAARGGSAGGLLMGAVANAAPDRFGAIIAEVPFVDALNTILDPTLPLTVMEWEEWGNPVESAEVYRYLKAYGPYENVEAKDYPAMLVTAGLNDPRVSYWEPAKWVARMRKLRTDSNKLLLKTEMGAGHGGPSGRYDAWRDEAFVLAFILDTFAVGDPAPGTISARAETKQPA